MASSAMANSYRDHDWDAAKNVTQRPAGLVIDDITLQALPIGLCREYYGFECVIWDACPVSASACVWSACWMARCASGPK